MEPGGLENNAPFSEPTEKFLLINQGTELSNRSGKAFKSKGMILQQIYDFHKSR